MYLILFDDEGKRITSLVEGIHGDNMEQLKEVAKTFDYAVALEGDEATQQKAMGDVIYVNGEFMDAPAEEVEVEEEPLEAPTPEVDVQEVLATMIADIEMLKGQ